MDKDTRNRLQRATQAARSLIEGEYAEQLEGTFDIRLDGNIPSEPGDHLDANQRVVWKKLVAAIGHLEAGGEKRPEAVQAHLREAAFTTLNRFVALKMLEARELVLESVSQGDQSSGFKEFTGLAPGLVQLPDHGYRLYIESLFDEIGREVRVLFDRRDPANLLWPRRQALQDLLEILNARELASVWIEDETIGWVYQYFNGEDERKSMREASQAPRNSRELAVRNQFFTPRYVVRFLVDNTLGRTWFEMMRGETGLKELTYLVRRQHEVFLAEGEAVPEKPEGVSFGESPEHPFSVRFRAKKDPRDLKILDPACGSGHFLLYTFDLLLTIFEEAWQDEGAAPSKVSGDTLRADYPKLQDLRTAAPELILRHCLHGIDIDPRAAQIAALALWLRAQRAFQEAELSRSQRPAISKTNIVVAEPMPGEADLREAFIAGLGPKLGTLVERVFDRMSLAGEAGYLLRIAEQMEESIRQIYGGVGGLFEKSEESEWDQAARDLRTALEDFAAGATTDQAFTRQLFSEDAARGLGFIDVCSQRYDVLVMNPPFGSATKGCAEYLSNSYPESKYDLYAAFLERGSEMLSSAARLGAITSRSGFFLSSMEKWRTALFLDRSSLFAFADLGYGVLDAKVETAAYVACAKNGAAQPRDLPSFFFPLLAERDKSTALAASIKSLWSPGVARRCVIRSTLEFSALPGSPFCYGSPEVVSASYARHSRFEAEERTVRAGVQTSNDFRFLRCWWEVPSSQLLDCSGAFQQHKDLEDLQASCRAQTSSQPWCTFAKGGEYSPYYADIPLVINWKDDGREIKSFAELTPGTKHWSRNIRSSEFYFRPGLTYLARTSIRLCASPLPCGSIISNEAGPGVFVPLHELRSTLGRFCSFTLELMASISHVRGSEGDDQTKKYIVGNLKELPWPERQRYEDDESVEKAIQAVRSVRTSDETSRLFTPRRLFEKVDLSETAGLLWELDKRSARVYGVDALDAAAATYSELGDESDVLRRISAELEIAGTSHSGKGEIGSDVSYCVGAAFGRFDPVLIHAETDEPDPFGPLPVRSPGMLAKKDALSLASEEAGQSLRLPADGILVDDAGTNWDIVAGVSAAHQSVLVQSTDENSKGPDILGVGDQALRDWLAREFFELHIKRYSKSRRKAPIYWQLATPSASYSAWLYYHRFTRDTLFRLLNDHVAPKLQHEERKLTNLTQDAGPNPTASQRKEIDAQETFVGELRAFRDEVSRVAPLWNPNLNDGVILNYAPLWRLVPQHKAWQKECKAAWDKLCKGDYDWAHLAMHLWPERVVPKCATDRSLAIAHGLEEVLWRDDEDGKWQPKTVSDDEVADLVAERTSPAVKAALKSLIEAPAPAAGRARAPRRKQATTRAAKTTGSSGSTTKLRERATQAISSHSPDQALLDQVRSAIATLGGNAAKSDILATAGLSASQWSPAIKTLLAEGSVTKTGQKRGTRYHLAQDPS